MNLGSKKLAIDNVVNTAGELYRGSISVHIFFCISLASLPITSVGVQLDLMCFNRGITAEAVTYFSPDRASVRYDKGLSTSTTVSITENSGSDGILHQFFLSSANTALNACCCSTMRDTIS